MNVSFAAVLDWNSLLLTTVGFVAGFVNTIAGGGTLLTLPTLIFLGLPPALANGTNRVAIFLQTVSATAGFKSKGVADFPFSLYCGISAFFGAVIGAQIAVDISGDLFKKILSVVMIVVVVMIAFTPKLKSHDLLARTTGWHLRASVLAFFFFGIYGGFLNAGIGLVILVFLPYFNKMSLVRSNASKVAIVSIYTLGALVVFALNDSIDWVYGLVLSIGNILGAWLSSRWSVAKGDVLVRRAMIVVVIVMAVRLWFF
jgi:uncharacterized membrane protein YfcA